MGAGYPNVITLLMTFGGVIARLGGVMPMIVVVVTTDIRPVKLPKNKLCRARCHGVAD